MVSPETFYYVDSDLSMQKTTDGGISWESIAVEFPNKANCVREPRKVALYVKADKTYSIFCVRKMAGNNEKLVGYSTIDNWATCTFDDLPEMNKIVSIDVNHTDDLLSVLQGRFIRVLAKR